MTMIEINTYTLTRTAYAYSERLPFGGLTKDAGYIFEDTAVTILESVDGRGCHRRLVTDGLLFAWVDAKDLRERAQSERACSDCEAYTATAQMTTKPDGRVICRTCDNKAQAKAIQKSQGHLFDQQPLF